MSKKRVESAIEKPEEITKLSFFECEELKRQIGMLSLANNGEISDDQLSALVEAQCQSPVKLAKLCNFIKLLEAKTVICKLRKEEINFAQKKAEQIIDRISQRLAPWVEAIGNRYEAGEYELTTRKSTSVVVTDEFCDPFLCRKKEVVEPDKKAIKEALDAGEAVKGCHLETKLNLQIK